MLYLNLMYKCEGMGIGGRAGKNVMRTVESKKTGDDVHVDVMSHHRPAAVGNVFLTTTE